MRRYIEVGTITYTFCSPVRNCCRMVGGTEAEDLDSVQVLSKICPQPDKIFYCNDKTDNNIPTWSYGSDAMAISAFEYI